MVHGCCTHIQLLLCLVPESLGAGGWPQPLKDDAVRPLAEEVDLAAMAHNHGHPLPHVVEVQDAQQLVHFHFPQRLS